MAANTAPIFSRRARVQWAVDCTAANANADITSGTSYRVFEADDTEGSWLEEIRVKPQPGANTAATVMRVWLNNGSTTGTATNSALVAELNIPATVASSTSALVDFSVVMKRALPPGYDVYVTFGTAPGGSGRFAVAAFGGDY